MSRSDRGCRVVDSTPGHRRTSNKGLSFLEHLKRRTKRKRKGLYDHYDDKRTDTEVKQMYSKFIQTRRVSD